MSAWYLWFTEASVTPFINGVPWPAKNWNSAALFHSNRQDQIRRGEKKSWCFTWHLSDLGNTDDTNTALLLLDPGDFPLTAPSVCELQRSPTGEVWINHKGNTALYQMNFCSSCGAGGNISEVLKDRSQWYKGFWFSKNGWFQWCHGFSFSKKHSFNTLWSIFSSVFCFSFCCYYSLKRKESQASSEWGNFFITEDWISR